MMIVAVMTMMTMMRMRMEGTAPAAAVMPVLLLVVLSDVLLDMTFLPPLAHSPPRLCWQESLSGGSGNGMRGGPSGMEVMMVHAVSRIFLRGAIDNIQAGR